MYMNPHYNPCVGNDDWTEKVLIPLYVNGSKKERERRLNENSEAEKTLLKDIERIKKDIKEQVIEAVIPAKYLDDQTKYFINPTGRFVIGGPQGDAGLTGRKIIVDTYGGAAHHGGGAFSGKDATKVDRSASYAARYIAKNIVAAGYAKKAEIQVAYAIGVAEPVSIMINTYGTGTRSEEELIAAVRKVFDLRPAGIIEMLDLKRPIYKQTAAYGHFGRTDVDLPWEHLDKVDELKEILG